jgi:ubiquinone/menaquinone biosynthesis C-methylase UbiE
MISKNPHRKYFNSKAHVWDTSQDDEKTEKLINIFQEFNLHPQGYILDIGCGTGVLIPLISRVQKAQLHLVELDFSENMLWQNKEKRDHYPSLSLLHVLADAHHLPFRDGAFQWIIGFAVLPHLSEQNKVLAEWGKVLLSGGNLLILHLMGSRELNYFHSQMHGAITDDRLPPVAELSRIVRQHGFEVRAAIDQEDFYLIHAVKD